MLTALEITRNLRKEKVQPFAFKNKGQECGLRLVDFCSIHLQQKKSFFINFNVPHNHVQLSVFPLSISQPLMIF
jgi:hypothetical protein